MLNEPPYASRSPVRLRHRVWQVQAPFGDGALVLLYLIRGSELAIIDTGVATTPASNIRSALDAIGLKMGDIRYVLNTHGHHDHMGGNANVKQESPGVKVFMHKDDRPFADSRDHHFTFTTEFLRHFGLVDQIPQREGFLIKTLGEHLVGVDRVLSDGDVVDLGDGVRLDVIHTPGHTPGSVSYYWESERLLFSGDAVQGRGSPAGGWPLYFHPSEYLRSLHRLRELAVTTLALGHPFQSGLPLNAPVKWDAEVAHMFDESESIWQAIDAAVRAEVARSPAETNLSIAREVVRAMLHRLPTRLEPVTGLPGAAATLSAHIREARGA